MGPRRGPRKHADARELRFQPRQIQPLVREPLTTATTLHAYRESLSQVSPNVILFAAMATRRSDWVGKRLRACTWVVAIGLLLAGCNAADPSVECRNLGRYEVGKEGGYLPCCPELNEISTLTAAYGPGGELASCQSAILNTYACISGSCGDGICEGPEEDCGCIRDCGGPSECTDAQPELERRMPAALSSRPVALECDRMRPCNAVVPAGDACASHAECTEGRNGRCQPFGYECTYDQCFVDDDCTTRQLCECASGPGGSHRCVPADCRIDTDCPDDLGCSPSASLQCSNLSGTIGYRCHTLSDECTTDSDCADGGMCVFDLESGRWVCSDSICLTD